MNNVYDICIATAEDIPELLALQAENQVSRGGALSIEFPAIWFENVLREMPIVIARRDRQLVGYLVSSTPEATRNYPLIQAQFSAYRANPGAYNSGPLCIDAKERGHGLVARLFDLQRSLLSDREGVAFIRRDNAASRAAHAKYGFLEVAEFSRLGVEYLVAARAAAPTATPAINGSAGVKVKAVLDGWEAAWNASDMTAMWQLATDDIHWVNVVGMHWRGKAEVQKAHQVFFDLLFKNRSCKLDEIESIEPLPGGAFVAVVRWSMGGYRRPNGEMRSPGKDRMSLVLVPRGEGLAIAHGANVPIDQDAEAHNPIRR